MQARSMTGDDHASEALPTGPRLLALAPDVEPPEYWLNQTPCKLGRAAGCQVTVARETVSRWHAVITWDGRRYILRDAGSANGTFVNDERLKGPHGLHDRDLIALGGGEPVLRYSDPSETLVVSARLIFDEPQLIFRLDGRRLALTATQMRLLAVLYRQVEQVCTREACAQAVWGRAYDPVVDHEALDQIVYKLRRRLKAAGGDTRWIRSVRGIGYCLRFSLEGERSVQ